MVATKEDIPRIVQEFVRRLEARGHLKVQMVILFGSYVGGWPHRGSDIDVAVVSDDFSRLTHLQQIELLVQAKLECDHRLEPLAFTLRQYRRASPMSFLGEVKRTGKVIYQAS